MLRCEIIGSRLGKSLVHACKGLQKKQAQVKNLQNKNTIISNTRHFELLSMEKYTLKNKTQYNVKIFFDE